MATDQTHHEEHQRKAEECDHAAATYEAELSTTDDARRRHELSEQIRREREAAAFYRGQADNLQSEA